MINKSASNWLLQYLAHSIYYYIRIFVICAMDERKLLTESILNIYKKIVAGKEISKEDKEELNRIIDRFNELIGA